MPDRRLVAGLVLATVAGVAGCSSAAQDPAPASPKTPQGTRHDVTSPALGRSTASDSPPSPSATPSGPAGSVEMLAWLRFGPLSVRAIDYEQAAVNDASPDSRIDVVTVEECAVTGPATLRHTTWHLIDEAGETLGVAGGKIVNGHPTEDIPGPLSPGQCVQTKVAIGVPRGSEPVAVKDGPDATWLLAD